MTKRRQPFWDNEVFEFEGKTAPAPLPWQELDGAHDSEHDPVTLDEAQEALSKLYNKTNKREKHLKGVRRKDAWQ